jgi:hypothetical protein
LSPDEKEAGHIEDEKTTSVNIVIAELFRLIVLFDFDLVLISNQDSGPEVYCLPHNVPRCWTGSHASEFTACHITAADPL